MTEHGLLDTWLGATDDGVLAIDASGTVVTHNNAASRVTGLPPEAATGRPWRDVLRIEPQRADAIWGARHSAARLHVPVEVLCAQGNLRVAEIVAAPWQDATGDAGILVLIRDLATLCRQRRTVSGREGYGNLVGAHARMQELYGLIEIVGPSDAPVVIEGETGVGKELVAQLLHARSRRAERPFIAAHCAALAEGVIESELFGHVRGAFTGAIGTVLGRFERAHTGTLFLDEVTEIPLATQVKLLRALQTGEIERVGEARTRHVDVRVIAATNRSLEQEVRGGRFRDDLYYRLKVVRLNVPPLRERRSDIPGLVEHFVQRHAQGPVEVTPAAMALLEHAPWPGNVRELENAVRHALALRPQGPLDPEVFPLEVRIPEAATRPLPLPSLGAAERRALLLRTLAEQNGNRSATARALGIGRATFYRWWAEAGLDMAAHSHGAAEPARRKARQSRDI